MDDDKELMHRTFDSNHFDSQIAWSALEFLSAWVGILR